MTEALPAVPLSRRSCRLEYETGDFASPSRDGFALFGGRRLCQEIDAFPPIWSIGITGKKLYAFLSKSFAAARWKRVNHVSEGVCV